MARERHGRKIEPYVPSPGALPLHEVVRELFESARTLDQLDDEIGRLLRETQELFYTRRPTGYPVDVPFPPWGKLAWSGRRGRWRLVVLEDEDCTDLFDMPRECRADACHLLAKLAERMNLL